MVVPPKPSKLRSDGAPTIRSPSAAIKGEQRAFEIFAVIGLTFLFCCVIANGAMLLAANSTLSAPASEKDSSKMLVSWGINIFTTTVATSLVYFGLRCVVRMKAKGELLTENAGISCFLTCLGVLLSCLLGLGGMTVSAFSRAMMSDTQDDLNKFLHLQGFFNSVLAVEALIFGMYIGQMTVFSVIKPAAVPAVLLV